MVAEVRTPQTLLDAVRHFIPDVADAYVRAIKWPEGPCCPKCGSVRVGEIKTRRRFQCREKECRHQFSLITGTIFESTHLRLDQWIAGVWMIVNCKNGVSSCEIARAIGCKQQSAWHLLHRVRHILTQDAGQRLGDEGAGVEADWTYVGGLAKHMSPARWARVKKRKNWGKEIVHAFKDRHSGTVRAHVVPGTKLWWIRTDVRRHVARGTPLYTDKSVSYKWARDEYDHEIVDHSCGEYVRGKATTNGCENFFNCLRRGLKGTYIKATPEKLHAYVDEQVYRFNHRHLTDWERFDGAMRQIVGKRLTYAALTDGAIR